jgi:hypothetical protein
VVARKLPEQIKFQAETGHRSKLVRAANILGLAGFEEIRGYGPLLLDWIEDDEDGLSAWVERRLRAKGMPESSIKALMRQLDAE